MKRPWQIWSVFAMAMIMVTAAMVWLSFKASEADRQRERDRVETELARRQVELQERISSALYRMDLKLLPLISQEAARPHYLYQAFYETALANPGVTPPVDSPEQQQQVDNFQKPPWRLPSPLLMNAPPLVRMHFQIEPDGSISSPQRPSAEERQLALACCDIRPEEFSVGEQQLKQAKEFCDFDSLMMQCAPPVPLNNDMPSQKMAQAETPQSIYSVPAVEKIRKQMDQGPTQQGVKGNKFDQQVSRVIDRGNMEFNQRRETTQQFAEQQWASNRALLPNQLPAVPTSNEASVLVGPMQPIWVDQQLLLARRVESGKRTRVQVCWLDWAAIRQTLKEEVADLLPAVDFEPVSESSQLAAGTALTTLPVQLQLDRPHLLATLALDNPVELEPGFSGLFSSLLVAWLGFGLACAATALLLHGVIRMSERRATFVSAVTHELRTPLTTFRMYAEMLAEKMVPESRVAEYAQTMRVQADRLSHLVENVLQFARLERGSQADATESVTLQTLVKRFADRLEERTTEAEMEFELLLPAKIASTQIETQPARIEQVLFNLVDNACKYGRPRDSSRPAKVEVEVSATDERIQFEVRDFGPGVDAAQRKKLFQAFCKSDQDAANSAPGVGLGLALCQRMARSLKGELTCLPAGDDTGARFKLEIPK